MQTGFFLCPVFGHIRYKNQSKDRCRGENCAVRIGFYKRKTVVVDNKICENVPIARWLCHRQGIRKSKHKTFSLLPYPLIPYHRHGLNVNVDTVNFHQQNGSRFVQTKDSISDKGVNTDIPLENNHIHDFNKIFSQARPAIGIAAIPSRPCSVSVTVTKVHS